MTGLAGNEAAVMTGVMAHGTTAGYERHLRVGEQPCGACRQAHNLRIRDWRRERSGYYDRHPEGNEAGPLTAYPAVADGGVVHVAVLNAIHIRVQSGNKASRAVDREPGQICCSSRAQQRVKITPVNQQPDCALCLTWAKDWGLAGTWTGHAEACSPEESAARATRLREANAAIMDERPRGMVAGKQGLVLATRREWSWPADRNYANAQSGGTSAELSAFLALPIADQAAFEAKARRILGADTEQPELLKAAMKLAGGSRDGRLPGHRLACPCLCHDPDGRSPARQMGQEAAGTLAGHIGLGRHSQAGRMALGTSPMRTIWGPQN